MSSILDATDDKWYKIYATQKEIREACELMARDTSTEFAAYLDANKAGFVDNVLDYFFKYYRKFVEEKMAAANKAGSTIIFNHTHMISIGKRSVYAVHPSYDKAMMKVMFTIHRKLVQTQDDIDRAAMRKKNEACNKKEQEKTRLMESLAMIKGLLLAEIGEVNKDMSVFDFIDTRWNTVEQLLMMFIDANKVESESRRFEAAATAAVSDDAPPLTYKYVLEVAFAPYDGITDVDEYIVLVNAVKAVLATKEFVCSNVEDKKDPVVADKKLLGFTVDLDDEVVMAAASAVNVTADNIDELIRIAMRNGLEIIPN